MEKKAFKSRIDPRIQTVVTASFKRRDSEENVKEGVITNFSRSGLFIETVFMFPVETELLIDVFLPDENLPLCLSGVVRNVNNQENQVKGMGISISQDQIDNADQERLEEFFDLNHIYGWFC